MSPHFSLIPVCYFFNGSVFTYDSYDVISWDLKTTQMREENGAHLGVTEYLLIKQQVSQPLLSSTV